MSIIIIICSSITIVVVVLNIIIVVIVNTIEFMLLFAICKEKQRFYFEKVTGSVRRLLSSLVRDRRTQGGSGEQ